MAVTDRTIDGDPRRLALEPPSGERDCPSGSAVGSSLTPGASLAGVAATPPAAPEPNGNRRMVARGQSKPSAAQRARSASLLFKASCQGLRLNPRLPYEVWQALGARIATRAESASWWLGDWLIFGEQQYGQRYRQAIETTGLDYQTLRNYAVVARRFKLSRRRDNLSFQHHAEVCALTFEEQDRWLDLAAEHHWSKRELRLRVREAMRGDAAREERRALRFMVDAQREDRWRRASARSGCSFEEWVVRSLDAAAGAAAPEPTTPRSRRTSAPRTSRRGSSPRSERSKHLRRAA